MKLVAAIKIFFCLLLLSNIVVTRESFRKILSRKSGWSNHRKKVRMESLKIDPELSMTTPELVKHRNYPIELHHVITKDGYILELHRIPPRNKQKQPKVVFFQHGLLATSARFLRGGKKPTNSSLVFLLADQGYDVWMGNSRGNTYSRNHVTLDPDELPYWDFTWSEMGSEDIPASLNYVMNLTGEKKVIYICLSFGCTLFFIAMSTQPELNNVIDVMVALAPSTSLTNIKDPLLNYYIVPFYDLIQFYYKVIRRTRAYADINNVEPIRSISRLVCRPDIIKSVICNRISKQYRSIKSAVLERIPAVDLHFPTGISVDAMTQFVQNIRGGQPKACITTSKNEDFRAFDFGSEKNLKIYGSVKPPRFDLAKVTAPVHIFWSKKDAYANEKDVMWVAERLGNLKSVVKVSETYNHFDFLSAPDVNEIVNYPLLNLLPPP